ncbi:hypothetical protein LCGC14_1681970, partial [marine sediment metagenome]
AGLYASGVGRQAHPPAGVSAVREAHDNVGAADRGVTQPGGYPRGLMRQIALVRGLIQCVYSPLGRDATGTESSSDLGILSSVGRNKVPDLFVPLFVLRGDT